MKGEVHESSLTDAFCKRHFVVGLLLNEVRAWGELFYEKPVHFSGKRHLPGAPGLLGIHWLYKIAGQHSLNYPPSSATLKNL